MLYWLTKKKKKVHRIYFPFLGIFISFMKWLQNACVSLSKQPDRQYCSTAPSLPSILSRVTWVLLFQCFFISWHSGKSGAPCKGGGLASPAGESTAGRVAAQGDEDNLGDTPCAATCRGSRMEATSSWSQQLHVLVGWQGPDGACSSLWLFSQCPVDINAAEPGSGLADFQGQRYSPLNLWENSHVN